VVGGHVTGEGEDDRVMMGEEEKRSGHAGAGVAGREARDLSTGEEERRREKLERSSMCVNNGSGG
jgi:hypothetical protein